MAMNPATFTRRRRTSIALNVLLASCLAPALGGLLVYLSFRPQLRARADLTTRAAFTLSDRTLKVLAGLERDVEVYTCFSAEPYNEYGLYVPGLDRVLRLIGTHANDLIREAELKSGGRLKGYFYNPYTAGHMGRIEELGQLLEEPPQNVVLVKCGDRQKLLRLPDLAEFDSGPKGTESPRPPRLFGFKDEEALTAAILSVTEERTTRVVVVQGHGERDPNAPGQDASGRWGFRRFTLGMSQQNLEVSLLDLSSQPLDRSLMDIVVLASPTRELPSAEVDQVVRFVQDGGSLLFLLDPSTPVALDFPLLDQLLGLRRRKGVVALPSDQIGHLFRDPFTVNTRAYGSQSPIVQAHRAKDLVTQFHEAVALQPMGDATHGNHKIEPLAWTPKEAWLDLPDEQGNYNRRNDPASEAAPGEPLTLGFSVVLPEGGRAVVFGDSDFLDEGHIAEAPGNRDLGLNTMEWLAEREQLISLSVQPYDEVRVDLTPEEYDTILMYVVGAIPALALLAALVVFWTRRN